MALLGVDPCSRKCDVDAQCVENAKGQDFHRLCLAKLIVTLDVD
jgi:hypothetical protein